VTEEAYLLDTNVVSEIRKGERCFPGVQTWLDKQSASNLFLSIVTLAEIQHGIELIAKRDEKQAKHLTRWRKQLENTYRGLNHLLTIDSDTALQWGKLQAIRRLPAMDAWLAATAIIHNLTIVTRNENDFNCLPVRIQNPWA